MFPSLLVGLFEPLTCVEILLLNHNLFVTLPSQISLGLYKLTLLELEYNPLQTLPGDVFTFLNIKNISISHHRLQQSMREFSFCF
jgi:Leucine-rich repeat (LRR) protein